MWPWWCHSLPNVPISCAPAQFSRNIPRRTSCYVMSLESPFSRQMEVSNGRQNAGGVWLLGNVPCCWWTCGGPRMALKGALRSSGVMSTRGRREKRRRRERGMVRISKVSSVIVQEWSTCPFVPLSFSNNANSVFLLNKCIEFLSFSKLNLS